MALTIFFRNGLTVAAKVDEKGPQLEIYGDGAELDPAAVEALIPVLTAWVGDMKRLGMCRECNVRAPLHRPGCRQGPGNY
jgi:hypothetical protein